MPYTVDLVHPPDVPRLANIQWAALKDNPLIHCLYPRGATRELIDFTTLSYQKALTFPSATLLKATDDATGEIVGFAKWILYRQDEETQLRPSLSSDGQRRSGGSSRRSSGWQKEKHLMPSAPPDCHAVLLEHWGDIMSKTRKRIPGPRGHACSTGAPCSLECYFANFSENLWGSPIHSRSRHAELTVVSSTGHSSRFATPPEEWRWRLSNKLGSWTGRQRRRGMLRRNFTSCTIIVCNQRLPPPR